MSHDETIQLINQVLAAPAEHAREILHRRLGEMKRTEPEFCAGVIEHGLGLNFTSEQWFDLFSKVPNMLFQHERHLMNKLTPDQRSQLYFE